MTNYALTKDDALMYSYDLYESTYDEYVDKLLRKYGPATSDYFDETAYADFKKGLRETPGRNPKISRTRDGLYCHHIDEDKQILISTPDAIRDFDIPFDYQKADRLVYCNLIEHAILHILIAIEQQNNDYNGQKLGIGGYLFFIRPQLIDWLGKGHVPTQRWELSCYNAISMSIRDAVMMIFEFDEWLCGHYPITFEDLDEITMM